MATKKAAKGPAEVRAELLEFAGYEDDADPEMQETLRDTVIEHVNSLGDDDETYGELSKEAQAWWESVVAALNKDKTAPMLPTDEEEEAPAKKVAAKKTAAKTNSVSSKPTAKKAGKAAPEKKEPSVSAADLIRIIVAKKPSGDNDYVRAELEKKGVECGDAQLASCVSFSKRMIEVLEGQGWAKG